MTEQNISTEKEAWKALVSSPLNLKRLSTPLLGNREFMKDLVSVKGEVIAAIQDVYSDDEEIVLTALSTYPEAVLYASERIRRSVDLALQAVTLNPYSYAHFTEEVRLNYEVALNAVSQKKQLFQFVPSSLREHDELRHSAGLSPLISDAEEARIALTSGAASFDDLTAEVQSNEDIILQAASYDPKVLKRINEKVWNETFTLEILALDLSNWKYVPRSKKRDDKFLQEAVRRFSELLNQLSRTYQKNPVFQDLAGWNQFEDFSVQSAVDNPVDMLSSPLKLNLCFVQAVLEKNGLALEFCSKMIQDDAEMVAIAYGQNPDAVIYASERKKQLLITQMQ